MSVNTTVFEGLSFEVYDPTSPNERHLAAAEAMIKATQGKPMLPLTWERLQDMPEYYFAFEGDELVGGRGLTFDYGVRQVNGETLHEFEMGGLRSLKHNYGPKIAAGALVLAAKRHPDITIVMAANGRSLAINQELGGTIVSDMEAELPPAIFHACSGETSESNPRGVQCPDYESVACALGLKCCELSQERGGGFIVFPKGSIPTEAQTIAELKPL